MKDISTGKIRFKNSPSKEEIFSYYDEHKNGLPLNKLSVKYNKTVKFFQHHFKFYGLLPIKQNRKENWNIYNDKLENKNHFFFNIIDSEIKAYLLGFFIADGNIASKRTTITINSSKKDKYIIDLFRDNISPNSSIIYSKSNNAYIISINSRQLKKDLAILGVYPNKTYLNNNLPNISEEFIHHLIRGFFDGDGWCSIYMNKDGYIGRNCGMCSKTIDILLNIQNVLLKNNINTKISFRKNNGKDITSIYKLNLAKKEDFVKLYEYFYKNCNYCLERKKNKMYLSTLIPSKARELINTSLCNA